MVRFDLPVHLKKQKSLTLWKKTDTKVHVTYRINIMIAKESNNIQSRVKPK